MAIPQAQIKKEYHTLPACVRDRPAGMAPGENATSACEHNVASRIRRYANVWIEDAMSRGVQRSVWMYTAG